MSVAQWSFVYHSAEPPVGRPENTEQNARGPPALPLPAHCPLTIRESVTFYLGKRKWAKYFRVIHYNSFIIIDYCNEASEKYALDNEAEGVLRAEHLREAFTEMLTKHQRIKMESKIKEKVHEMKWL